MNPDPGFRDMESQLKSTKMVALYKDQNSELVTKYAVQMWTMSQKQGRAE